MEELGTGEGVLRGKAGCEDCDCGTDYETEKGMRAPIGRVYCRYGLLELYCGIRSNLIHEGAIAQQSDN